MIDHSGLGPESPRPSLDDPVWTTIAKQASHPADDLGACLQTLGLAQVDKEAVTVRVANLPKFDTIISDAKQGIASQEVTALIFAILNQTVDYTALIPKLDGEFRQACLHIINNDPDTFSKAERRPGWFFLAMDSDTKLRALLGEIPK